MKRRNKIWFAVFLAVFLGAVSFGVCYWYGQQQSEERYEKLAEEVHISPPPSKVPEVTQIPPAEGEPQEEEPQKAPAEIPIDFAALQAKNPDIYAWIQIAGTKVDYPIVQSNTDNNYYLNHTIDGVEGYPGSIYTESLNKKDFRDGNTVIYGHNMKNGTMFASLHKYVDPTYMKEHPEIVIYTPEHKYTYQVFAAVTYDDRHILSSFDFSDSVQFQKFLDSINSVRNMSTYRNQDVTVTTEDKIITLSTCNNDDSQRFLVEAVLISEE